MNRILLLFSFISLLSLFSCADNSAKLNEFRAEQGVLDLRQWKQLDRESIELEGEWEFYWEQFIDPSAFTSETERLDPYYAEVPGTWNGYKIKDDPIPGIGFATYHLRILLNDNSQTLQFKFLSMLTAYTIYIDGNPVASGGEPGTDEDESIPGYYPQSIAYKPEAPVLDLVIHISNFDHRKGGLWGAASLGSKPDMERKDRVSRDRDLFIIGAIFVIGIYYFGLYLIRRKEREAIYFALFCTAVSLRIFVTGEILILQYITRLPWRILIDIEYLTFFSSIPLFLLFIYSLYRSPFLKKTTVFITSTSVLFSLITIVVPVEFSSYLIPIYQIITVFCGIYVLIILVSNSLKRDILAMIILAGFLAMFIMVINDILYSADLINSFYAISYGLLLFIIFQSTAMTIRFAKSFGEVERQQRQLQKTNLEYRSEIEERIRLEEELHISYQKNAKTRLAIIMGLAKLAEYRDSDTGTHIERIQEFNAVLAKQLQSHSKYKDYITDEYIKDLHISSILHDIGKVGIPDSILQKPGKLTEEEFTIMKEHSIIGGDSIKTVEKKTGVRSFLTLGRDIAYMHHEKWDGTGYPRGIKGEEIPLSARITALADVYDALTTKRCYKEAYSHEKAIEIIVGSKGTHFDPEIVDAFMEVETIFNRIRNSLHDEIVLTENFL